MCNNCLYPEKKLWAIGPPFPKWTMILSDFVSLVQCPECGQLWVEAHYEPFASFRYAVPWQYDKAKFLTVLNVDAGRTLSKWHEAEVRALANKADEQTLKHIEAHYRRSRGNVDLTASNAPNSIHLLD